MASQLSTAEHRILQAQWLRSGRCLRCFHTSRRLLREEQPKSTRRLRAAAIADEVENVAAQAPSAPPSEADTVKGQLKSAQVKSARQPRFKTRIDCNELLRLGQGTSTIAGGNFQGVLVDKLRQNARPAQSQEQYFGSDKSISLRSDRRLLTAFVDKQEKDAYHSRTHRSDIKPPSEKVQQYVTDRLVLGKYEGTAFFDGKEKYKQPTLNDVARAMTLNSSYASKDAERFVSKVRGLIPAVAQKKTVKA